MQYDVTVRFSNIEDAKHFVEGFLSGNAYHADVINAQAVPVNYCKCGAARPKHFTQGSTYGWWVCPMCNYPTKMVFDKWGFFGPGINLIPQELLSYDGVQPLQRSPKEWSDLAASIEQ